MRGLEEQKLKEALAEKSPEWQLYCYMGTTNLGQEFWNSMIKRAFDNEAGDENDRWTLLQTTFKLE